MPTILPYDYRPSRQRSSIRKAVLGALCSIVHFGLAADLGASAASGGLIRRPQTRTTLCCRLLVDQVSAITARFADGVDGSCSHRRRNAP